MTPIDDYARRISGIESGGRYSLLGPVTRTGDRAHGKYQVMGANIPEWTRAALGREMTPQEFLNDPQAQDAVFQHRFGSYVNKYGPENAAKAWFAGEGGMNNPHASDQLGTTVASYANKFNAGGGDTDLPSEIAQGYTSAPASQFSLGGAGSVDFAPPKGEREGPDVFGGLQSVGASLMSINNPKGAAVLAELANKGKDKDNYAVQVLPDGRVVRMNRKDGTVEVLGNAPKQTPPKTPLNETGLEKLITHETAANGTDWLNQQAEGIVNDLKTGKLNLSLYSQWVKNPLDVATNTNSEQREALSRFEQFKTLMANEQMLRAKGVQTEGDAIRAIQQYFAGGAQYNNKTAQDAMERMLAGNRVQLENAGRTFDAYGKQYPGEPVVEMYRQQHQERMKRYSKPAPDAGSLKKKYGLE